MKPWPGDFRLFWPTMPDTAVAATVVARTAGAMTTARRMAFSQMVIGDRQLTVVPPVSEQSAVV